MGRGSRTTPGPEEIPGLETRLAQDLEHEETDRPLGVSQPSEEQWGSVEEYHDQEQVDGQNVAGHSELAVGHAVASVRRLVEIHLCWPVSVLVWDAFRSVVDT